MLGVLLYAYCAGERSSRRIEQRLCDDVAFRVIAANQQPDHATLARFRRRHQDAIDLEVAMSGQPLTVLVDEIGARGGTMGELPAPLLTVER